MRKWILVTALAVVFFCLAGFLLFSAAGINDKLARLVNETQARVFYALNPPQEAVFVPQEGQVATVVEATMQAMLPAATQQPHACTLCHAHTTGTDTHTAAFSDTCAYCYTHSAGVDPVRSAARIPADE